jgi:YidC/Oxa1 family membrane protein insertase
MWKEIFDRNTFFGIILISVMVGGYLYWTKKKIEDKAIEQKIQQSFKPEVIDTAVIKAEIAKDTTTSTEPLAQNNVLGESVKIENELVIVSINTKGAFIENAKLKKHLSHINQEVDVFEKSKTKVNLAFGKTITGNTLFTIKNQTASSITFASSEGVEISYKLEGESYQVVESFSLPPSYKGQPIKMSIEGSMARAENNLERERMYSTVYYIPTNDDLLLGLDKMKNETKEEPQPFRWVSFGQQFFNYSVIPNSGFASGKFQSNYQALDTGYVKQYKFEGVLNPKEDLSIQYYLGPSDYKLLKTFNNGLETIVPLSQDFVLFRWMKIFNVYLIIPVFDFLSNFFTNYGIIILILTLFIKLITAPFQYKTYKSGVAMRILKPDLDKLKAKCGDDQQKYATEQMKIFSEVGVSPFGGCLPMLMQMPILFAMFSFFPSCIDLRHEPFLWAKDLSTYDSVLNLPFEIWGYGAHVSLFALLSAVTQIATTLYSQRLQPSSPQADQMKMMTYLMPAVFLFMFNKFPAALTFYYFLQNVLGILQQWFFTTFVIKEDKVRAEMELAKKTPKKQGAFQQKMNEMMAQAEQQKKLQQNQKKK